MDERAVLAEHLRRIVGSRLLDALDILFDPDELSGEGERLRELLTARSRSWADILSGEDDRAAAFLAVPRGAGFCPGRGAVCPPRHMVGHAAGPGRRAARGAPGRGRG